MAHFLNKGFQRFAPLEAMDPEAPRHWKEKVLYFFMALSAPGVLVLIICGLPFIMANQYWLLLVTAVCALSSSIIFVFFSRKIPYLLRSLTASFLVFIFGMAVIVSVGPLSHPGNGYFYSASLLRYCWDGPESSCPFLQTPWPWSASAFSSIKVFGAIYWFRQSR